MRAQTCLFQNTQRGRAGASRSTPGCSAWHAAPVRSRSCTQASGLLLCCFLQPSHPPPPPPGVLASLCKGSKAWQGASLALPWGKRSQLFFRGTCSKFHTFFSPQMWETSSNPLYKRVFSHMQIKHVNACYTALPCPPQTWTLITFESPIKKEKNPQTIT